MKTFYYAFRVVRRATWSNFFRIFSLALGILIGSLIFCRTAFFESFDDYAPRIDETYFLSLDFAIGEQSLTGSAKAVPAIAPTLMNEIPIIDKATRFHRRLMDVSSSGDNYHYRAIITDSLFFDLFPISIIDGDADKVFVSSSNIAISHSAAQVLFPNESAVGKVVKYQDHKDLIVEAVFEDFPINSYHSDVDIILDGRLSDSQWHSDSYYTFFTTTSSFDAEVLNTQVNKAFAPHLTADKIFKKVKVEAKVQPFDRFGEFADFDSGTTSVMNYLFLIIGVCVILIVSLNFVLLQINSLISRHKEVGVHKASGARTAQIFGMIICETSLYAMAALLLAVMMLFVFKAPLEAMLSVPIKVIFGWGQLWAVGVVLLSVVLLAGVIPAIIFARIPINSIFSNLRSTNLWWKQILLFVEITTAMVAFSVTFAVLIQYRAAMNLDLGYTYDKLYAIDLLGTLSEDEVQILKSELLSLTDIEDATLACNIPLYGMSGLEIMDRGTGDARLSARSNYVDPNFFSIYGIRLLEGKLDAMDYTNGFVNEHYLRVLDTHIGEDTYCSESDGVPVGTFSNIKQNVYTPLDAMYFTKRNPQIYWQRGVMTILGCSAVNGRTRLAMQEVVDRLFVNSDLEVSTYEQKVEGMNVEIREIRDGIFAAALILLMVTFIGVMSYVATEIKARRRQIVVRRTFGASVKDIVMLVGQRLFILSGVCFVVAILVAHYAINMMLSMLPHGIEATLGMICSGGLIILGLVLGVIYVRTKRIATHEYVNYIGKI